MTDYFIGIDLGTTHCALAYVKRDSTLKANAFATFNIPQLVGPGEIAKRPLLPCFRYHAGDEIHPNDRTLPFDAKLSEDIDHAIIGEWAKRLGTKTSSRLVTSAKSWLTLSQNCNIACLPFNETQTIDKVSPLMATASYLNYLRAAWDYEHPNSPLAKQTLVITIPASFDEGARQATAEAAGIAGLSNVSLLEEPQAACYHWLSEHQAHDTEQRHEKLLLVCDIGGGTTDLSLLKISNNEGKTQLHRIAVGDHLMLGGDNMDLALAAKALSKTSSPSHSKVSALSSAAQAAKETLLSENSPETASLTLLGQGRKLLGQSQTFHLTQEETLACLFDDFFPLKAMDNIHAETKAPLMTMGLPFESDPVITHHLGQFIQAHQSTIKKSLGLPADAPFQGPDALLLNGSLFKSESMQARIAQVTETLVNHPITLWHNSQPDLAVALGAVYSALSKEGLGTQITGGSARHFFLTLRTETDPQQAICLLPKGSLENQPIPLDQVFELTLNQDVKFELLSSNADADFQSGDLITLDTASRSELNISPLPPLMLKNNGKSSVSTPHRVSLTSEYSDIGLLAVFYQGENALKGQLRFATRQHTTNTALPACWPKIVAAVRDVYGKSQKSPEFTIKNLKKQLEKLLGRKESWSIEVNRALCDELITHSKRRRRSAQHERLWFHLTGFSLRPGFGDTKDSERLNTLWPLYQNGLQYEKESHNWIDWWNFWRRISGGLSADQQKTVYQDLATYFSDKYFTSNKLQQQAKKQGVEDLIKLAANLEKLPDDIKQGIAQHLVTRLTKKSQQPALWWALGRLGSREMITPKQTPLPSSFAETLLEITLKQNIDKIPEAALASAMIAKQSKRQAENISNTVRDRVAEQLNHKNLPKTWLALFEGREDTHNEKAVFGETLPIGITLHQGH